MEKTLEFIKDKFEDELKVLKKKGDLTPEDVKLVKEMVCTIKDINEMMKSGQYSEGYSGTNIGNSYGDNVGNSYGTMHGNMRYSGTNRSPVTGRYISNGSMNGNSYGHEYPITYGYSGHSIHDRMIAALEPMYDQAKSEHERQVISNEINRIRTEM